MPAKIDHIPRYATLMVVLAAVFIAVASCASPPATSDNGVDDGPPGGVMRAADEVMAALVAGDGPALARWVHPVKGVRFSPSAYVDPQSDLVFSAKRIEGFWQDVRKYTWGYAEGSGDPIVLTPRQYWLGYVMDRGFAHPSSVNVNQARGYGTTANNAAEVYPHATRIEYYLAPSRGPASTGTDWAALRLVFEKQEGSWFLVGVIHDEWSV